MHHTASVYGGWTWDRDSRAGAAASIGVRSRASSCAGSACGVNDIRLVVVTGPTGSGKSTTLAALIEHINRSRTAHILTIEDPIEFEFERNRGIISQREIQVDVPTFAQGVKDALRFVPRCHSGG